MIAFTGLEAAAVDRRRGQRQRASRSSGWCCPGSAIIVLIYVGIALVGISALPVHHGISELGQRHLNAPVLGRRRGVPAGLGRRRAQVRWWRSAARSGSPAAAGSSMLGVSRVGYSLATNRQIPSADRPPAAPLGDAVRGHRRGGDRGRGAGAPTDLELLIGIYAVRRAARVHDRPRLGDRPALPRADARTRGYRVPLSVPVRGGAFRSRPCSVRCCRRPGSISVMIFHSRRALRRPRLAARRAWSSTSPTARPSRSRCCAGHDPRAGAAPRGARARVRLDPRADLRHAARRRHRPDRRPAGRRDARRRRGGGSGDRGDLGVRDAAVAAARRAAARRARSQRARRRWPAPRRWGRSTRAWRWPPRSSAPGGPARRSSARPSGAGSRRSCSPPRSPRGCAAARCSAASRPAGELRRRDHQVRDQQGAVPGDPHRAAGRLAGEVRARARVPSAERERRREARRARAVRPSSRASPEA